MQPEPMQRRSYYFGKSDFKSLQVFESSSPQVGRRDEGARGRAGEKEGNVSEESEKN
jgi:hypothetical protein